MKLEYVDKTEQIYRLLRKRILEGELTPGSRLIERRLAEELKLVLEEFTRMERKESLTTV